MNVLSKKIFLLGLTAFVSVLGSSLSPLPANAEQSDKCEDGGFMGFFKIRTLNSPKYVKVGLRPSIVSRESAASLFKLYDLSKLPGGSPGAIAIQSAGDDGKWWYAPASNQRNVSFRRFDCRSSNPSGVFIASRRGDGVAIKASAHSDRWLSVSSLPQALILNSPRRRLFKLISSSPPAPSSEIGGWWRERVGITDLNWWYLSRNGNRVKIQRYHRDGRGPTQILTGDVTRYGINGVLKTRGRTGNSSMSWVKQATNRYTSGDRTFYRSNQPPSFRVDASADCPLNQYDVSGWWRDSSRRSVYWKAEKDGSNVTLTRYRQSDGSPYQVFTGNILERDNTPFYSSGVLDYCFQETRSQTSFRLEGSTLKDSTGSIQLIRVPTPPSIQVRESCNPVANTPNVQRLTLQKRVLAIDKEVVFQNPSMTWVEPVRELSIDRPRGANAGRRAKSSFESFENRSRDNVCVGGEVKYAEWDQVQVDALGAAHFYVNVALYEGDNLLENITGNGCPVNPPLVHRHYSIPVGMPDGMPDYADPMWEQAQNGRFLWEPYTRRSYRSSLQPGPLFTVPPGESVTQSLTLDHPDAKLVITYTLTNHTARIRVPDN